MNSCGTNVHDSGQRCKVNDWINDAANDFSHFVNYDDDYENRSTVMSDNDDSIVSDESEFISVSQQSGISRSEENHVIKLFKNEKKVYKSCVKPTKKQLLLRQLPKLFTNEQSAADRPKNKLQSKSLVDLNKFIDNIKVGSQQSRILRKSSFNQTVDYNNSIQHYLSPEAVLPNEEPNHLTSSASESYANTDSDPDWSESIDLHNVFAKQKKYRTTHFKFQMNSISDIKLTDDTEKSNVKNYKKLSKNKRKLTEETDKEEKQPKIRTFRLRSMLNNRFIHKAKSIKEAEEIYNNYKLKSSSTDVKKRKSSKINFSSEPQNIGNDSVNGQNRSFNSRTCKSIELNGLSESGNKESICNEEPLNQTTSNTKTQNNFQDCNQRLSNDTQIKSSNFVIDENNAPAAPTNNTKDILENNFANETDKIENINLDPNNRKPATLTNNTKDILENNIANETDRIENIHLDPGNNKPAALPNNTKDILENNIANEIDRIENINLDPNNNKCLQDNITKRKKTKSNKVRKMKKRRKQKSKSLKRKSCVLQSPGWSKLVGKLNELNVSQCKCRKSTLDVTVILHTKLSKYTDDNNCVMVDGNQVNRKRCNLNNFQNLYRTENLNYTVDKQIANEMTDVYLKNVNGNKDRFDINNNINKNTFPSSCDILKHTFENIDENIVKNDPLLPGIPNSFSWCNLLINNSNKILEWPNVDSTSRDILNDNEFLLSYVKGDSLESDNSSSVIPPSIPDISEEIPSLLYFKSQVNRQQTIGEKQIN